jgi:hypothetical protein
VIWISWNVWLFNFDPYPGRAEAANGRLVEERFGATLPELTAQLLRLDEEGRAAYATLQWLDLVSAVLTTVALTLALAFSLQRFFPTRHAAWTVALLPSLLGLAELAENGLLLALIAAHP